MGRPPPFHCTSTRAKRMSASIPAMVKNPLFEGDLHVRVAVILVLQPCAGSSRRVPVGQVVVFRIARVLNNVGVQRETGEHLHTRGAGRRSLGHRGCVLGGVDGQVGDSVRNEDPLGLSTRVLPGFPAKSSPGAESTRITQREMRWSRFSQAVNRPRVPDRCSVRYATSAFGGLERADSELHFRRGMVASSRGLGDPVVHSQEQDSIQERTIPHRHHLAPRGDGVYGHVSGCLTRVHDAHDPDRGLLRFGENLGEDALYSQRPEDGGRCLRTCVRPGWKPPPVSPHGGRAGTYVARRNQPFPPRRR